MKSTFQLLTAVLPLASAYPAVMEALALEKRQNDFPQVPPPAFTTDRDNCGSHGKCTVFDAEDQLVPVSQASGHEVWMISGSVFNIS